MTEMIKLTGQDALHSVRDLGTDLSPAKSTMGRTGRLLGFLSNCHPSPILYKGVGHRFTPAS